MNTTVKIILLHLIILASQAVYMYLSSKSQMKRRGYLYLAAIPLAAGFPAISYHQDVNTYSLYEYAVVICIISVAVADISFAAILDRDYITDERLCMFIYTYFLICVFSSLFGRVSPQIRIASLLLFAVSVCACSLKGKHSLKELFAAAGYAFFSVACSGAIIQ